MAALVAKRAAYAALEARYLWKGVPRTINGTAMRLPARWSRYYPAVYETGKTEFLRSHVRADSTALDLGAHIGVFTVELALRVGRRGRVVAFEPAPATCDVLRRTVSINHLMSVVDVRQEAVAGAAGTMVFHETGDACSNASSLVKTSRTRQSISVAATTLDALSAELGPIGFVKMDIEGAEVSVLRAAEALLARDRPAMTIEVHPVELEAAGALASDVFDLLVALDYELEQDGIPITRDGFGQSGCFEIQARPR